VSGLLARASRRFLRRHPAQPALALAGIALGVAVVVGVDIANDSARRAFALSVELTSGHSTHQLLGLQGSLPETLYPELRRQPGVRHAAPVIEARIRLPDTAERAVTLLGLDPLAELPFRAALAPRSGGFDVAQLIVRPGTVMLPRALAETLGTRAGDRLRLEAGGRPLAVEVIGIADFPAAQQEAVAALVLTDVATAQELLGQTGLLTRIDLILTPQAADALTAAPPAGTVVLETAARNAALGEMTQAFHINLTALSLLALVVGMFLIYATLSFLVVQRRQLFGIERALGATRRQIVALVLAEALLLGLAGTAAGLLLGHSLGSGLITLVLQTIEDFWFSGQVAAVAPSPWSYGKGALLGLGATLLAALAPALEAGSMPPRATLSRADFERRARRRLPWLVLAAVAAAVIAAVLLVHSERNLTGSFAGLFAVVAAAALVTPALTLLLLRLASTPAGWIGGLPGRLAARGAETSLSRTAVAVAALTVAAATVIGVSVMIGSFRGSVERWLELTLQADFYLRADNGVPGSATLPATVVESVAALPGVAGLSLSRWRRLPAPTGDLLLRAHRPGPRGWGLYFIEGDSVTALPALEAGRGVVVAEPLARRRGLGAGGSLELPALSGTLRLPVLGVFRDYSSDRGAVVMHLDLYRRHWRDAGLSGIGIYLEPDADATATGAAIEALAASDPTLGFTTIAELRRASRAIFERTFTITRVLRWLAGLVAFCGILAALAALALERAHETAVLRALGFTPRQVRDHLLAQTGLLGLVSGLLALPVGVVLAGLLVFVINERAFGWSMELAVLPQTLAGGVLLALAAALLAGLAPAWRLARAPLAAALREE